MHDHNNFENFAYYISKITCLFYIHVYACIVLCMNISSQEFIQELGVYVVGFDKPGYGESDPHPNRTVKSLALDIEELGDQLGLGSKFYVIGNSMGGQDIWGCLKYIPSR